MNTKYSILIDAGSGYHHLTLDDKSLLLTAFSYQFGRYRYKWPPFGSAPASDMFKER